MLCGPLLSANGCKDDRDSDVRLPRGVFSANNANPTDGGAPSFIDWDQHLPLPLPDLRAAGEPPPADAARVKASHGEIRRKRGAIRPLAFQMGDQMMLQTQRLLDAAEVGKL